MKNVARMSSRRELLEDPAGRPHHPAPVLGSQHAGDLQANRRLDPVVLLDVEAQDHRHGIGRAEADGSGRGGLAVVVLVSCMAIGYPRVR